MSHSSPSSAQPHYFAHFLSCAVTALLAFGLGRATAPKEPLARHLDASPSETSPTSGRGIIISTSREESALLRSQSSASKLISDFDNSPLSSLDFESFFHIWEQASELAPSEIESLLLTMESQLGGAESYMVSSLLANQWGASGGSDALEYFLRKKNSHDRNAGFAGAMVGWMKKDPEQAYLWLQDNEARLNRNMKSAEFVALYFSQKANQDYPGALAQAIHLKEATRKVVLQTMTEQAATNPEQREQLFATLRAQDDPQLLRRAENQLLNQLSWQNGAHAMSVLNEFDVSAPRRVELEGEIMKTWVGNDPRGALEWQQQELKGTEGAGDQIADSFRNWVGADEAAASEWLRSQGDEFQTDLVFQKAGEILQQRNPERAAEWQAQVFDDSTRQAGYKKLYNRWKRQDTDAAQSWILSLPEFDRAALLETDGDTP